jgi:PAS domain S-box-containing protein
MDDIENDIASNIDFHALVEEMQDAVLILKDEKIIFANACAEYLFRESRKVLVGGKLEPFLSPDTRQIWPTLMTQLAEERVYRRETAVLSRVGTEIPCLLSLNRLEYGNVLVLVVVMKDVSFDKQNIERLVSRLELLQGISTELLSAEDPAVIIHELCRRTARVLGASLFLNYLKHESDDGLILNTFWGFANDLEAEKRFSAEIESISMRVFQEKRKWIGSRIFASDGGLALPFGDLKIQSYICVPIVSGNQTYGTLSFGTGSLKGFDERDVELVSSLAQQVAVALQRRRVISALSQVAEKLRLEAEKSVFSLAAMVHEVRNPLAAIAGMMELALTEEMPPSLRKYVTLSVAACQSLMRIANNALDVARLKEGKVDLEVELFDLREVVKEVVGLFQAPLQGREVALDWRVRADVPKEVLGDALRLRQILVNLVGNAVKFTERGWIFLDVELKWQAGGYLTLGFEVSDTGPGIPVELHELIFERFAPRKGVSAHKVAGAGLGLSIVKGLVELMGGAVRLKSEPGRGSVFSFTAQFFDPISLGAKGEFGAFAVSDHDTKREPFNVNALEGTKILLVEDDMASQVVEETALSRAGCAVKVVADSMDALEYLSRESVDVILMDVGLPGLDGVGTCAAIRALPDLEKAAIPIVAVTAFAMESDRIRCMKAGMNGYISKPFHVEDLLSLMFNFRKPASESLVQRA